MAHLSYFTNPLRKMAMIFRAGDRDFRIGRALFFSFNLAASSTLPRLAVPGLFDFRLCG